MLHCEELSATMVVLEKYEANVFLLIEFLDNDKSLGKYSATGESMNSRRGFMCDVRDLFR